MKEQKKRKKPSFRRSSEIPGEYRRTSVVPVTRIRFNHPDSGPDGRLTTNHIVTSIREAGAGCDHTVEVEGVKFQIPGEVVERMLAQRDQTLTEQRKDQGRINAEVQPIGERKEQAND